MSSNWIKIEITEDENSQCYNFAKDIILTKNQYNRMIPKGFTEKENIEIRIKRTFVGKIGELIFFKYLRLNGINIEIENMFKIYDGQTNVDKYDFRTTIGDTIDIKTAVFKNHKKLVIPYDQFVNIPKNFYVGIKLILPENVNNYFEIIPETIKSGYICGYYDYLTISKSFTTNLGESTCKAVNLEDLLDISYLLKQM